MTEDELLISQGEDKVEQCRNRNIPQATGFLDPHQQSVLRAKFRNGDAVTKIVYYGGYDDAERVMMICLPDYLSEPDQIEDAENEFLSVIRTTHPEKAEASSSGRHLSHGDYLGALMGLGISRETVGDILVRSDGADIIVPKEMESYIMTEFRSAGRSNLEVTAVPVTDLILPKHEMKEYTDTVASPRLDNIVSSAFGLSRAKAVAAIKAGLVFVDHMEALKPSVLLKEGQEIVVRHKGRAILSEFGGTSRKGRQYISYLKD